MAEAPRERGIDLGDEGPQLFLSHSSKDNEFVTRLAQNLNTCGVDVWLDTWELRVGVDLHGRIADAIAKSKFVAVVLSRHFKDSKWNQGEVHQALAREESEDRVVLLPLLAEEMPLPPVLSAKKHLELTGRHYFPNVARLAALVHDQPTAPIEEGIRSIQPTNVNGCIRVLRYVGFEPFCIVGTHTLREIEQAGGVRRGSRVHFSPSEILESTAITPSLRALMQRLVNEWRD